MSYTFRIHILAIIGVLNVLNLYWNLLGKRGRNYQ